MQLLCLLGGVIAATVTLTTGVDIIQSPDCGWMLLYKPKTSCMYAYTRVRGRWTIFGHKYSFQSRPKPSTFEENTHPDADNPGDVHTATLKSSPPMMPPENVTLLRACKIGMLEAVMSFVSSGDVINTRDDVNRTLVMVAAKSGHFEVVKYLTRKGCDITAVDRDGNTILHLTCVEGHMDIVKYLLLEGADIDARGKRGFTPIFAAIRRDHVEIVRILYAAGCDAQAVTDLNNTVLHIATSAKGIDVLKFLVSKNIHPIDVKGVMSRTPLHMAIMVGNIEAVKYLVSVGASMTTTDQFKDNSLHIAAAHSRNVRVNEIMRFLLAQGAVSLEEKGETGNTVLLAVVEFGIIDLIKLLLKSGSDIGAKNANGANILHQACKGGALGVVKFVYKLRFYDVNCLDHYGKSPVFYAAKGGHVEIIHYLIRQGCDLSLRTKSGKSILQSTPVALRHKVRAVLKGRKI